MRRSRPLRVALFAVAMATVLAGVGVLGAAPPAMTLSTDTPLVTYPAAVTLIARVAELTSATPTLATLEVRPADSNFWTPVGSVGGSAESTTGQFAFVIPANKKTAGYRVRIGDEASAPTTVTVRVPMGKPVASTPSVKAGKKLRLTGTIRPQHPIDATMTLQFQKRDSRTKKWKPAGTRIAPITTVIDNDTTQWTYVFSSKRSDVGSWQVRSFHQCVRHAPSYSAWSKFTVTE